MTCLFGPCFSCCPIDRWYFAPSGYFGTGSAVNGILNSHEGFYGYERYATGDYGSSPAFNRNYDPMYLYEMLWDGAKFSGSGNINGTIIPISVYCDPSNPYRIVADIDDEEALPVQSPYLAEGRNSLKVTIPPKSYADNKDFIVPIITAPTIVYPCHTDATNAVDCSQVNLPGRLNIDVIYSQGCNFSAYADYVIDFGRTRIAAETVTNSWYNEFQVGTNDCTAYFVLKYNTSSQTYDLLYRHSISNSFGVATGHPISCNPFLIIFSGGSFNNTSNQCGFGCSGVVQVTISE